MSEQDVKIKFEEDVKEGAKTLSLLNTYHRERFFHCLAMLFEELAFMNHPMVSECLARYKVTIKQNPDRLRTIAIDFPGRAMVFLNQETLPEPIRPSNRPRPESKPPENFTGHDPRSGEGGVNESPLMAVPISEEVN